MKIAAWNVNSIKVRLPHVLTWLEKNQPDVLCLQELKCESDKFPYQTFQEAGYHCLVLGQKTYNGVALISRTPGQEVLLGMPDYPDSQQRVISARFNNVRVVSAYCPNGSEVGADKYYYKLEWFNALHHYLKILLSQESHLVIGGDFNIAPTDADVHDPKAWKDKILCSPAERAAFFDLLTLGLVDSFRLFKQPEKSWSWWDYRTGGFERQRGLRIDHLLVSNSLASTCLESSIDPTPRGWERPSDHAPVWTNITPPPL
ncbi:MAG: exodeoxyribonuclease III [Ferrovum sp.]|nr:exodeoxyribonuclease III [Ferrovum sp.]